MPAHSHRKAGLTLAGAVILAAALAGCSGNAATPAYTGPAPTVAQSGQVFTSPQLDITLTPVSGAAGLTVPDSNGGLTITVSKTGQPQLVTQNGNNYVPGDGLSFVAVEVAAAQLATPYPTWSQGTTQQADTSAQFLIDNAPIGQSVSLPAVGATANWTVTAPADSTIVLQVTSGTVVQTVDAHTGQPMQSRAGAAPKGVTFAGEDAPAQSFDATPVTWIGTAWSASISVPFPAGTAYLTAYVDGAGWAPEGQAWLLLDFKNPVASTSPQCGGGSTYCGGGGTITDAITFSLTTSTGQTVTPFGAPPEKNAKQLLYQVSPSTTGFSLAVDCLTKVDVDSTFAYTPSQLDFTHTYTLTFQ